MKTVKGNSFHNKLYSGFILNITIFVRRREQ